MIIQNLTLKNFRNYESLNLDLDPGITIFIGNNAQGKSNILEAIYFLASTKSLRAVEDVEMIYSGTDHCYVSADLQIEAPINEQIMLEIAMQQGEHISKRTKVNGVNKRVLDYLGNFYVVSFTPEDINLVIDSPSLRRWHMDLTIAMIDKQYKKTLSEYSDIISSRNRVLKNIREGLAHLSELSFWSEKQLVLGQEIAKKRTDFFDFINSAEKQIQFIDGELEFVYKPNLISSDRQVEYLEREIASATSLIGPHRDDFSFVLKNDTSLRDLSRFGSRGQQRSALLQLKLLEMDFMQQRTKVRPVLLLDDVFSELDHNHRQYVFSQLDKQQTIIATVELEPELEGQKVQIYRIASGQIT